MKGATLYRRELASIESFHVTLARRAHVIAFAADLRGNRDVRRVPAACRDGKTILQTAPDLDFGIRAC